MTRAPRSRIFTRANVHGQQGPGPLPWGFGRKHLVAELYTVQHACTSARLSGRSSPHTYDSSTDRQNMQRQGPAGIRFLLCFSRPQSCSAPGGLVPDRDSQQTPRSVLAKPSIIIVDECVDTSRAFRGSPFSQPRRPLQPNELAPPTAAPQVLQSTADVLPCMYLFACSSPRSLYWVFVRDMEQWLALATELPTAPGRERFDCLSDGALGLLFCLQLLGWPAAVARSCFLFLSSFFSL